MVRRPPVWALRCAIASREGSHTLFDKQFDDGEFTYPIPTHSKDVNPAYVKGARRKFRLTPEDVISDDEFFGQA